MRHVALSTSVYRASRYSDRSDDDRAVVQELHVRRTKPRRQDAVRPGFGAAVFRRLRRRDNRLSPRRRRHVPRRLIRRHYFFVVIFPTQAIQIAANALLSVVLSPYIDLQNFSLGTRHTM